MTAQLSETLYYNGYASQISAEPLQAYLKEKKIDRSLFKAESSACWRGYRGTWEFKNDRLFLVDLKGNLEHNQDGKNTYVGIDYLFPHQTEVFAEWFSGVIRIPAGKLLEYIHFPYKSVYEKEVVLLFQNGLLIKQEIKNNRRKYFFQRVLKFIFSPLNRYIDRSLAKKETRKLDNMFKND